MITLSARGVLDAALFLNHTSVSLLELPTPTENALLNAGITTLAHLARADLERVIGVGIVGEAHIRTAMRRLGFSLEVSTLGLTVAQEEKVAA